MSFICNHDLIPVTAIMEIKKLFALWLVHQYEIIEKDNFIFFNFSPKKIRTGKEEIACLDINFELDLCFNPSKKMVLAIGQKR
jgi:hypothetical protein